MSLRRHRMDTTMHLCRKRSGVHVGLVCEEHSTHCVICDTTADLVQPVRLCDDCALSKGSEARCTVCNATVRGEEPAQAMYCRTCVRLERDRDGCPRILGMSEQRRGIFLRDAGVTIN